MRDIYANPYKYAVTCNLPIDLAKIMCKKQRHLQKMERKHTARCPKCNSKHLNWVGGSLEEGCGDYLECETCGSAFDFDVVPNSKYMNVGCLGDFDALLYFSCYEDKLEGWKDACGATTHEQWIDFARKIIFGRKF